ncbi:MAG: hypothetical protein ACLR2G_10350 [Phascolarctobacterium faecium]
MLKPYQTIGRALALFKAAGLAVPAYGEEEKRRLLDVWVQRYGALDSELFLSAVSGWRQGGGFAGFMIWMRHCGRRNVCAAAGKRAAMPLAASFRRL